MCPSPHPSVPRPSFLFSSQVLYTYLNVPFLELKRKALLQQAEIASERLEKEYQELAGFIGGHSYGNYMQHLRSSDVDPTAGASIFASGGLIGLTNGGGTNCATWRSVS